MAETPIQNKIAVINGLVDRSILLSNKKFHKENIVKAKNILKENNYPIRFINKYITKRLCILKNKHDKSEQIKQNESKTTYISLPFINGISNQIGKLIENKTKLKICYNNKSNLRGIYTQLKTKIPMELNSGVVYKINCEDCDGTYIGQTKNYLRDRINTHKRSIAKGSNETALSQHANSTGHKFNFQTVKILEHEKNHTKRTFKEMIHIKKTHNINNYTDIQNLSTINNGILQHANK